MRAAVEVQPHREKYHKHKARRLKNIFLKDHKVKKNQMFFTNNYAMCFLQKLPLVSNRTEIFISQEMWKFAKNC